MPTHRSFLPERLSCAALLALSARRIHIALSSTTHDSHQSLRAYSLCAMFCIQYVLANSCRESQLKNSDSESGLSYECWDSAANTSSSNATHSCHFLPFGSQRLTYRLAITSWYIFKSNCGQVHWDIYTSMRSHLVAMMDRELLLSTAATFIESFICCEAATADAFLHCSGTGEGAKPQILRSNWPLPPIAANRLRNWQLRCHCSAAAAAPSHHHSVGPKSAGRPLLPSSWRCHDNAACRMRMQCPVLRESRRSHPPNGANCPACI